MSAGSGPKMLGFDVAIGRARAMIGPMSRTYSFRLMVTVDEDHEGYDDPEWLADAAWGALTNLYGARCVYTDIETLDESSAIL